KSEAAQAVHDLNTREARAQLGDATTVGAVWDLYVADRREQKPWSVKRIEEAWKPMQPHFAHVEIEHVARKLSRDYISKRRRLGVSDVLLRAKDGTAQAVAPAALFFNDGAKFRPRIEPGEGADNDHASVPG